jgi:hypothetical protein
LHYGCTSSHSNTASTLLCKHSSLLMHTTDAADPGCTCECCCCCCCCRTTGCSPACHPSRCQHHPHGMRPRSARSNSAAASQHSRRALDRLGAACC